jgi:PBP1b-binding outer membrane lipoprotein LpoB
MKIIALGLVAAFALAGCSMESKTVEQSTTPSAGPTQAALSYPAHNMAEYDSAMQQADDHCYKQEDLRRAHYVDRDFETAHFECQYR